MVIGTDPDRSATYDNFLLMFHDNHGPISYRFREDRWFRSKIANSSHPRLFSAPAEGIPSNLVIPDGLKKLHWWGHRAGKKFDDISSRLDTIHECDRQTDGQTDGETPADSKNRAYA